ncbi:hypothetical protein PC119_g24369 [Phytophthora cactorum]|nr:hypothetical protein PC119_g24369 [Phytophthora cactorum]
MMDTAVVGDLGRIPTLSMAHDTPSPFPIIFCIHLLRSHRRAFGYSHFFIANGSLRRHCAFLARVCFTHHPAIIPHVALTRSVSPLSVD